MATRPTVATINHLTLIATHPSNLVREPFTCYSKSPAGAAGGPFLIAFDVPPPAGAASAQHMGSASPPSL
jgi:hypothetical protein